MLRYLTIDRDLPEAVEILDSVSFIMLVVSAALSNTHLCVNLFARGDQISDSRQLKEDSAVVYSLKGYS